MTLAVAPVLRWLGGKIDIRVEVETLAEGGGVWNESDWNESNWAVFEWQDITAYTLGLRVSRGQPRWGSRFQAGNLAVTLDNVSGIFTPEVEPHLDGVPWRPGRKIRILAFPDPTTDATVHRLFTGRIDDSQDHHDAATIDVTTLVAAYDAIEDMKSFNPPALETATGVSSTHQRVEDALDRLDWPAGDRDIDTGEHTMQTSFLAQTCWEEVARAGDAEGGAVFADPDNHVVFKHRDWLTTDTRSTEIQGYLGYLTEQAEGVPHAPITDVKTSWETRRIRNDIQFARSGSDAYRAQDLDSQTLYGRRTHQFFDFQNNSDAEVEFLADRYLAARKDLRLRVDSVSIAANADPDNLDLNRLFYNTQFGDLFAVNVDSGRGWGYERQAHVVGVDHQITPDDWTATFTLDDAALAVGPPE